MTLPFNETINEEFEQFLNEDAPVTAVAGVATRGIPLGKPPKGLAMKKFAGMDVFAISPSLYPKSRQGKKKFDRIVGMWAKMMQDSIFVHMQENIQRNQS